MQMVFGAEWWIFVLVNFWRAFMQKRVLAVCALVLGSLSVAYATPLAPGGSVAASTLAFGGSQVGFFGGSFTVGGDTINYASEVFADPLNTLCSGCLTFVYLIDNFSGVGSITDVTVGNYGGALVSVGYSGSAINPTTISRSADGSLINFLFPGIPVGGVSPGLVVETNDFAFASNGTIGTTINVSGTAQALQPIPEPTTFVLLGTGLMGLAGAARRKLLA
jgi:hypothetical protein